MTESVIVTGRDLVVEQTTDQPEAGMPIRPRPGPVPSTVTKPSAINSETVRYVNPFWSAEANTAADQRAEGVTPRDIARKFKNHRIEDA